MSNLVDWIAKEAAGETIEAVVIGEMGWGEYGSENVSQYASQKRGVVLSWEEASPMIDYEFDNDFGAPGCNAVIAWTASWVIMIGQYDGSTWPYKIPRNPMAIVPGMQGG